MSPIPKPPGLASRFDASNQTGLRRHPFIAGAVYQSSDDVLEHDSVRDPAAMTAQRMRRVELGLLRPQHGELDPDGFEQRRWQRRHGTPLVTKRRELR
ncbi:hypothetical protein Asi03nite_73360 [Actinoplanes siamensis]|uniref:Uncharacterized protein n=1 Tax=Actinoplanes siamensis TaxID=1223317 RepID=A0A919NF98_9ACTN|nr:hypothetical protein Asi03nite_73360 [Actinoplanes siamensis]